MRGTGRATIAQTVAADLGSPPAADVVISTRDLTLSFGQRAILSDVSCADRSDRHAQPRSGGPGRGPDHLHEPGRVVEHGETKQVFEHPEHEETANYVGGRFG
jgi:hypothetical protein